MQYRYVHADVSMDSAWADTSLLLVHRLPGGEMRPGGTVLIGTKKERTRRKMTALETMVYI